MTGLSRELYKHCQEILIQCDEFNDRETLLPLFVRDELSIFRDRLPTANDKLMLVSKTIDFLLHRNLANKQPVLPIFLEILRDRYDIRDAIFSDLESLYFAVNKELLDARFDEIPIVVMAMNRLEANDLLAETVFQNEHVTQAAHRRFMQLKNALQAHNLNDISILYSDERDDWVPSIHRENTIREILINIIDYVNQQHLSNSIVPYFLSESFFSPDHDMRRDTWHQVEQTAGVLVVDSISLFHPILRRYLLQSQVISNKHIAILVLAPINYRNLQINYVIEEEISSEIPMAFSRFDQELDKLCEFGISDLRGLQRWLFSNLPESAKAAKILKPVQSNRKLLRSHIGNPQGMEKLVFGKGGDQ